MALGAGATTAIDNNVALGANSVAGAADGGWAGPPIGGTKRKVSGMEPQPSPSPSHSIVQTASFCQTIGSVHHSLTSPRPPSPGVNEITSAAPTEKTTSLTM